MLYAVLIYYNSFLYTHPSTKSEYTHLQLKKEAFLNYPKTGPSNIVNIMFFTDSKDLTF